MAGTVTLTNTFVDSNDVSAGNNIAGTTLTASPGNGGGIHISSNANVTINGGTVNNNDAGRDGGGIRNSATGVLLIRGGTQVNGNTTESAPATDDGGGGIFNQGGTLTIDGLDATGPLAAAEIQINNNRANNTTGLNNASGGGLLSVGGIVMVTDTTFDENEAIRAGGGIEIIDGTVTLTDVEIRSNDVSAGDNLGAANVPFATPGNGGGLHVSGTSAMVTIDGGVVTNNDAGREGGGLWNQAGSTMIIRNGTLIRGNSTESASGPDDGGGGIFNNGGTLTIDGSAAQVTIEQNVANNATAFYASGGGILSTGGTVEINDALIRQNEAIRAGGGIEIAGGTLSLTNVNLNKNDVSGGGNLAFYAPGHGGGLHVTGSSNVEIVGGTVNQNTAGQEGGGLWNGTGTMTIDGTTINGNSANASNNSNNDQGGGGIFNAGGTLEIDNTSITNNTATMNLGNGGGVMSDGGTVTITGGTISGNSAARAGGGIENLNGMATLTGVALGGGTAIEGNSAGINGGGLHVSGSGTTNIDGGSIQHNSAGQEGGGLWNASGNMTINNSSSDLLIANNTASGAATDQGGGGIFNSGGSLVIQDKSLNYSISIANNLADGALGSGGGIFNDAGGTVTFDVELANDNIDLTDPLGGGSGGGFEKIGSGLFEISNNANTFTGDFNVNSGILHVDGKTAPGANFIVANDATLGGVGTIDGDVTAQNGATVAPGNSPGIINTGNLNLQTGSNLNIEIEGIDGAGLAMGHDQVNVMGAVNLAGELIVNGNYAANVGDSFVIINNDGTDAVTGMFAGLSEGAEFLVNVGSSSLIFSITYADGVDSNDVVLTALATPTYDFSQAAYLQTETDAPITSNLVMVTRSGNTAVNSSVDVVLTGNSATASDFLAGSITVSFGPGETSKTVPIEILGDTVVELDETIDLSFQNFVGGGMLGAGNPTSELTIVNDDSATIAIDNVTRAEGLTFDFTVTLSNPVDVAITLQADTAHGTTSANDFSALNAESFSFAQGTLTQTVAVQTTSDFNSETNETFFVNLSNLMSSGRSVSFSDDQGLGTILDLPLLAIDDVSVFEGDQLATTVLVPVRLSEALSADLFVQFSVLPGTASESEDYLTLSGDFTIPAGETMFEFPVSVVGDLDPEPNETFSVRIDFLSSPGNNVAVSDAVSVVTILNDDQLVVTGVKVGSTEWTTEFREFIDTTSAGFGYPIPIGVSQTSPIPWANINQIQLAFNADITNSFDESLFGLGGFHTADYGVHIANTVFDPSEFTVTMTLDTFLGDDQFLLVASDLLTQSTGAQLDGEWTTGQNSNRSGDGIAGGNFEFRFDVLPGDVNQSGELRSNDGFAALQRQFQDLGATNYLAFADIDGDGEIRANDGFFALQRQFTELPKGIPTAPPLPHPVQVDLAIALLAGVDDDDDEEGETEDLNTIIDKFLPDSTQKHNWRNM